MSPLIIYLTGFRQHAGKTVTSLGIISQLRKFIEPEKIGYIKPVGQQIIKRSIDLEVDKDVELISTFSKIPNLPLSKLSPVRFSNKFTRNYLTSKNRNRLTRNLSIDIEKAIVALSDRSVIIAEGSGHPGVGSIVVLSNAIVAKILKAQIIFVSGGGIGRALDMIDVDLTYFLYNKCQVRGLILNKLIPSKLTQVKKYITEKLINEKYAVPNKNQLHIFGYMPNTANLSHPSMRVILGSLPKAEPVNLPENPEWSRPCGAVKLVSLPILQLESQIEYYVGPRDVLIISASSGPRIRLILNYHKKIIKKGGIAGLILTCGETESIPVGIKKEIISNNLPSIYVSGDSANTEERLFQLYENTKLQIYDKKKVADIEDLFNEYFYTEKFMNCFF